MGLERPTSPEELEAAGISKVSELQKPRTSEEWLQTINDLARREVLFGIQGGSSDNPISWGEARLMILKSTRSMEDSKDIENAMHQIDGGQVPEDGKLPTGPLFPEGKPDTVETRGNEISSAKEGLRRTKEIIGELLKTIPDVEYLTDQYSRRMKEGNTSTGVEYGQLMTLRAELQDMMNNINTRESGTRRRPDSFSFGLILPSKGAPDRLEGNLGALSLNGWVDLRKNLSKFRNIVNQSWEMVEQGKYV